MLTLPTLKLTSLVLAVLANLALATLIYKNNPKSITNKIFVSVCVANFIWLIVMSFSIDPTLGSKSLQWIRLNVFFAVPLVFAIFLLSYVLPSIKINLKQSTLLFLFIILIISLGIMVLTLTPYVFSGVKITGNKIPEADIGEAMPLFVGYMISMSILSVFSLVRKVKNNSGQERQQVLYVTLGVFLMLSLIIGTILVPIVIFKNNLFVPLFPIYPLIFIGFTAYAIIRHKFLDIKAIVARTVSYSLLLFIIISSYTILIFAISELFPFEINQTFISIFMVIFVAFSFNPLRNLLERTTDRIFFKGRYDTEELLGELTHIMASEIEIDILSKGLLGTLIRQVRLTKGAFVLTKEGKIGGIESVNFEDRALAESGIEMVLLDQTRNSFVYEELEAGPLKTIFRNMDISIALVLRVKTDTIGVLVLGAKASGEIYNSQDIELLEIFAPQAAISLQNSESYREIQEFTRTLEKKVEDRTKELEEVQKRELELKDQFVFIATHDLRTPVTAINGYLSLIQEAKESFSTDTQENFSAILEASGRLNQLVNDLLQVARGESGTIKINLAPTNIIDILKTTLKQIEVVAQKKNVTLVEQYDETHNMAMADKDRLAEVMENLLSNAVKFSRSGENITLITKAIENALQISVSDTGYGIPASDQPKVFDKFFMTRTDTTREIPGTGLGLFVVKMLVEKMGGKIGFTSVEGKGTTFTFSLPLVME